MPQSTLLTATEVCDLLQISRRTLQRLCAYRKLSFIRIGQNTVRFRREIVDVFLRSREVRGAA